MPLKCKHLQGTCFTHIYPASLFEPAEEVGFILCDDCTARFDLDDAPDGMVVRDPDGQRQENLEHPAEDPRTGAEADLDKWQAECQATINSLRPQ